MYNTYIIALYFSTNTFIVNNIYERILDWSESKKLLFIYVFYSFFQITFLIFVNKDIS